MSGTERGGPRVIVVREAPGAGSLKRGELEAAHERAVERLQRCGIRLGKHQRSGSLEVATRVQRWGGVLLCDPVGSGKTLTAIAAGLSLVGDSAGGCLVIAPPRLVQMWEAVLASLGLQWPVVSDGLLSAGKRPDAAWGPVLVDEAHRFRNRGVQRRRMLEQLLVDRRRVLITATPRWRSDDDLCSLVELAVGRSQGVRVGGGALGAASAHGRGHGPALAPGQFRALWGSFVVQRDVAQPEIPCEYRLQELEPYDPALIARVQAAAAGAMPRGSDPAALFVQGVCRALESSAELARNMLRRSGRYLERSIVASRAGRALSRQEWARQVGSLVLEAEQLVFPFWFASGDPVPVEELEASLVRVQEGERALQGLQLQDDPKFGALLDQVGESRGVLCFTEFRTTAFVLARAAATQVSTVVIAGDRAWSSSLGPLSVAGALQSLAPGSGFQAPRLLILTPVGSEGLNLQHLGECIVHYDLPWTRGRFEQRIGRLRRLGGPASVRSISLSRGAWAPPWDAGRASSAPGGSPVGESTVGGNVLAVPAPQDGTLKEMAEVVVWTDAAGRSWCRRWKGGQWWPEAALDWLGAERTGAVSAIVVAPEDLASLPSDLASRVFAAVANVEAAVAAGRGPADRRQRRHGLQVAIGRVSGVQRLRA